MIDWSRVAALHADLEDEFDEVVSLYLDDMRAVVDRLTTAPEGSKLAYDLHYLKNGALALGLTDLAAAAQAGEKRAAAGDPEQVDLGALGALFERTAQELLQGLREGTGAT